LTSKGKKRGRGAGVKYFKCTKCTSAISKKETIQEGYAHKPPLALYSKKRENKKRW